MWPIVEYAHPNYVYQLFVLPDDPRFVAGDQAGLHPTTTYSDAHINIDPAWDLTVGDETIKVGVYDEGINWDHEDFSQDNSGTWAQSRVKGGWDYVNGSLPSTSTSMDKNGHGSACAGIIGAIRNNDLGVAGIAGGDGANNEWGVSLYAMKITENNSFVTEAVIADAIAEGATSFNGSYGYSLNIMNHSWGGPNMGSALKDAIRFSYRNQVILSVASGNTGNNAVTYPASAPDLWVLKVGASDEDGNWASFSTTGNNLDFVAPGTKEIYATTDALNNNTYAYNQDGTSFAAPHAAGLAALMLSYINTSGNSPNNLAPEDVEHLMQRFAKDIDAPGYDNSTGFGIIDAGATLQGIRWPRYEVKHYSYSFNNNSATKTSSNVWVTIGNVPGLAPGNYMCDIYEVTYTFDITQPAGRTVLDVWVRNSTSTLAGGTPVNFEVNCGVTGWNQTSASMKGYIYHIKMNTLGQFLFDKWAPSNGLTGTGTLALTVYSEDPLATNLVEVPIVDNLVRVVPNPSNGHFSLMFTLLKPATFGIQVTDITGKVVYARDQEWHTDGHQQIDMDLRFLNNGVYFCTLYTAEGIITRRISIVR